MRVSRCQKPSAQIGRIGQRKDEPNHRFSDSLPAISLIYKHIAKPSKRLTIRNNAAIRNLLIAEINADDRSRSRSSAFDLLTRNARAPIGSCQPRVNEIKIHPRQIIVDLKLKMLRTHDRMLQQTNGRTKGNGPGYYCSVGAEGEAAGFFTNCKIMQKIKPNRGRKNER